MIEILKKWFKFEPGTTGFDKILFFILLPFAILFGLGVGLWWLAIQCWKVVGCIVFRENLFKK